MACLFRARFIHLTGSVTASLALRRSLAASSKYRNALAATGSVATRKAAQSKFMFVKPCAFPHEACLLQVALGNPPLGARFLNEALAEW